jgi:hypothetical protein
MSNCTRYLGLDVHAETISAAVAEGRGKIRSLGKFPNEVGPSVWPGSIRPSTAWSSQRRRTCALSSRHCGIELISNEAKTERPRQHGTENPRKYRYAVSTRDA